MSGLKNWIPRDKKIVADWRPTHFSFACLFLFIKKIGAEIKSNFFPESWTRLDSTGVLVFFWFTTVVKHKKRFKREKKRRKKTDGSSFVCRLWRGGTKMKLRNTKPEPVGIFVLNNTVEWGCKLSRVRTYSFRMNRIWVSLPTNKTVTMAAAARSPRVLATWKAPNVGWHKRRLILVVGRQSQRSLSWKVVGSKHGASKIFQRKIFLIILLPKLLTLE